MKKLRLFAVAALAAITMSATAQVTYGNDYQYQPEKSSKSYYGSDNEGFSTLYVQYNPSKLKYKSHGSNSSDNVNALSLGYSYSLPLGDIPLYLEFGGAAQWFFRSHEGVKFNMVAVKIPINVMYSFDVSDAVSIQPYAGVYGRVGIIAQEKYEGEKSNLFSKDEMGDFAWKRFQFGWNAGIKFRFAQKFTVGAGYFMDLTKIMSYNEHKYHFQGFDITLGLNF